MTNITYPLSAWLILKRLIDPLYLSANAEEKLSYNHRIIFPTFPLHHDHALM